MSEPSQRLEVPQKILVHQVGAQADGFENLRAAVGGDGGDAHLGHGFDHALDRALEEVVNRLVEVHVEHVVLDHLWMESKAM